MKLNLYLIFLAIAMPICVHAQKNSDKRYREDLSKILALPNPDTVKAKASFLLSDDWSYTDSLTAKAYLEKGKRYGKGNKFMEALSIYYTARLLSKNHPDTATKMYLIAEQKLRLFNSRDALIARAKCWHDYSKMLHHEKDDSEGYIDILLNKSIPLALKANDSAYVGKNYLDVAIGFKNLTEFKKAKLYLIKAIDILEKAKESVDYLASAYHTLSENYSLSGNPEQAAVMLERMRKLLTPYPDSEAWLDYYAGEAMRLTVADQYDKSLEIANKGILLAQKLKEAYPEQRLLLQKFYAFFNKNDFLHARDVGIDLTKRKPFMNISANRTLIFYGLALTYEKLNDVTQAYKWLKQYSRLNDSLTRSNLETKVNTLEIKFRNAENQKKIVTLNAANEKAKLDAKNNRLITWLLGSASLFLLAVAVLVLFFYRSYKRSSAQKAQIGITQAMIQAQEEERGRVARDLHDGLGGMLTAVKLNLEDYASENQNADNTELPEIIKQLNGSVAELRRIAHNMMPEMLLKLGLEASLKDLCKLLRSKTLHIDFQCLGIKNTIRIEEQIIIYRIIQELLTNTVKHANAENVLLQCAQHGSVFFITIEDDGKGFDTNTSSQMHGIGLSNIKNRVAYLHGVVELLSTEQQGTSINIELNVTT